MPVTLTLAHAQAGPIARPKVPMPVVIAVLCLAMWGLGLVAATGHPQLDAALLTIAGP